MTTNHEVLKRIVKLGLLMMIGVSMSACGNSTSWKEEVLLHDGGKVIVERYVDRGGRSEIGQRPPIKKESLSFTLPTTNEHIRWKNDYSEDVGFANFMPLLLDIFQGSAYVVTTPAGCLSYNKWGGPNPPYVIFKYQGKTWQRITLEELPAEIKTPNIIVGSPDSHAEKLGAGLITTEMIQQVNSSLTQPEYKSILREEILMDPRDCGEMVGNGKGRWDGIGWFKKQASLEACLNFCTRNDFGPQFCPCNTLFKGK